MRWRYVDEADVAEAAARAEIVAKMDAWWEAFRAEEPRIRASVAGGTGVAGTAELVGEHLGGIDGRLQWEGGPDPAGDLYFAVTGEGDASLRPLLEVMVARAPSLPGWRFLDARPAIPAETMPAMVEGRTGTSVAGWTARAERGAGNTVAVTWFAPGAAAKDEKLRGVAVVATEVLLGERRLGDWIGEVTVEKAGWLKKGERPDRLAATVGAVEKSIVADLPDAPCWKIADRLKATAFGIRGKARSDVPLPGQDDVLAATALRYDVRRALLDGVPFASTRFSRHGETFLYVKLDGRDGLLATAFDKMEDLDAAVKGALEAARLGTIVGTAAGSIHSYVDLAVTDVPAAVEVVRKVLREGRVPRNTWILFHDAHLASEWIGIHPDTPPPPG